MGIALLRAILAWLFMGVYWALFLALYLVTFKKLPKSILQRSIRLWGKITLRIAGLRLEFDNPSTLEDRRPRVVVCNHQSALDVVWGAVICPPAPLAIGKKEVIFIPVLNLIWWVLDFIRVDRKNTQKAVASLRGVADEIRRNRRTLFLAPEGTRTPDGSILPFKKGAFHLAIQSQAEICPVVVSGAYELMPKHRFLPKTGVIRLRFLEPIPTHGLTTGDVDMLLNETRQRMIRAYEELEAKSRSSDVAS